MGKKTKERNGKEEERGVELDKSNIRGREKRERTLEKGN